MPTAVLLEIPCLYLIVSEIAFIRCSFRCCERCWAQYLSLIEKVVAGEERMEQRRHAHDVSLRASDSCLPKGGAAQLSFVPSPDGIVSRPLASEGIRGQAHEYPQMPAGASSSESSHLRSARIALSVRNSPLAVRQALCLAWASHSLKELLQSVS